MKIKFLTVIFFLLSTSLTSHAQLWLIDPLEAIYPDINNLDNYNNKWKTDYEIGSIPTVHILFRIPKGQVYSVSIVRNNVELPSSVLNKLINVPVEQNTGLDSRTEQYLGL
jgi:hypothetical protein